MNSESFTEKTLSIIQKAQEFAQSSSHSQVVPLHLAIALLEDDQSFLKSVVSKCGADPQLLDRKFKSAAVKLPVQSPPPDEIAMSQKAMKVLRKADELRKKQEDHHIAVDHLLLALLEDDEILKLFTEAGINKKAVQEAIAQIRGTRKVESRTSDATYEALSKYAIDLVEMAQQGKLDPVIGRDDEIRRVIQILARRTKNNPVLIGEPGVGMSISFV